MHVTFLTRISALIYRRGLRQRVASLTLDCNGVFAIRAYTNNDTHGYFSQLFKCAISVREFTEQHPAPDGSTVEPPDKVQRRRVSQVEVVVGILMTSVV